MSEFDIQQTWEIRFLIPYNLKTHFCWIFFTKKKYLLKQSAVGLKVVRSYNQKRKVILCKQNTDIAVLFSNFFNVKIYKIIFFIVKFKSSPSESLSYDSQRSRTFSRNSHSLCKYPVETKFMFEIFDESLAVALKYLNNRNLQ